MRSRRPRSSGIALAIAVLLAATPGTGAAQDPARAAGPEGAVRRDTPLRLGTSLQPDTVTVGDPFIVQVRVQAPRGATIEFPPHPDSTFAVQALDPVQVIASPDTSVVDRTAIYRLAAWDVGRQPVTFPPVSVTTPDATRRLTIENVAIFVRSVLPADSAERVPKPARAPFEFPGPWWLPWLIALLIAAIVGLLLWWLWRRRRREAPDATADPLQEAEAAFARIEAMHLLEAGERGRYVALVTEVLRDYLAATDASASVALTTRELVAALQGSRVVPVERLHAVLRDADLVKFANRPVSEARAREIGREARQIVLDTQAARAAALAEAAAAAEREARRAGTREAA